LFNGLFHLHERETGVMGPYDRESWEYSPEMEAFQAEQFEWGGEAEWGGETEWGGEAEWGGETEWGGEAEVFSEAELMELSGELLEVTSEAELDLFLGNLIKKAGRALGKVVRSPSGKAVGGFLKGAAKKALPLAGAALGGIVGGPLGAKVGSGLASAAGSALGLEAEMLNAEDREFEGAKQFVKMAGDAVKSAVTAPPKANPLALAQSAVTGAAQKHAPGLLGGVAGAVGRIGRAGRWVRKGRNIVLVNAA
jgi:hypothetical protein